MQYGRVHVKFHLLSPNSYLLLIYTPQGLVVSAKLETVIAETTYELGYAVMKGHMYGNSDYDLETVIVQ